VEFASPIETEYGPSRLRFVEHHKVAIPSHQWFMDAKFSGIFEDYRKAALGLFNTQTKCFLRISRTPRFSAGEWPRASKAMVEDVEECVSETVKTTKNHTKRRINLFRRLANVFRGFARRVCYPSAFLALRRSLALGLLNPWIRVLQSLPLSARPHLKQNPASL
jgi:hypothetical protein